MTSKLVVNTIESDAGISSITINSRLAGIIFYENETTVTTDYTISAGKNAMTAGPITINNGVTITIPANSVWSVV
jgi:hypothetical protein